MMSALGCLPPIPPIRARKPLQGVENHIKKPGPRSRTCTIPTTPLKLCITLAASSGKPEREVCVKNYLADQDKSNGPMKHKSGLDPRCRHSSSGGRMMQTSLSLLNSRSLLIAICRSIIATRVKRRSPPKSKLVSAPSVNAGRSYNENGEPVFWFFFFWKEGR